MDVLITTVASNWIVESLAIAMTAPAEIKVEAEILLKLLRRFYFVVSYKVVMFRLKFLNNSGVMLVSGFI